jgi:nucleoside-diphosphate-sugar epimerase
MPDAIRDFIYVDDVVDALFRAALLCVQGFRVFNIGSGRAVRVRDVVSIAGQIFAPAVSIEIAHSHPGELTTAIADIGKARKELGWVPKYDIESGLIAIKASRDQ